MVDWSAIKTEYVTTDTSYRKLCDKYGVSMTEVSRHGKEEEWRKERKKYQEKAYAKTQATIPPLTHCMGALPNGEPINRKTCEQ